MKGCFHMKVLVAGANGTTGRQIVSLLAKEENHTALAMIRKEEQIEDIKKAGGEPVLADLEGNLDQAVQGVSAVIFAAGSGPKTGPDKTTAVDRDGAISLIDAAKKAGVKRFVMLSAIGSDTPEQGPEGMQHYFKAKLDADEHLKQSGLTYTIVRPGALTNEEGTGKIIAQNKLEDPKGKISRADVAQVIVSSLEDEKTYNQTFEILNGNVPIKEAISEL